METLLARTLRIMTNHNVSMKEARRVARAEIKVEERVAVLRQERLDLGLSGHSQSRDRRTT